MGDKEFEEFLNKDGNSTPECVKRLLFDILKLKLENTTELIGILSQSVAEKKNINHEEHLNLLLEFSKIAHEQLDYLLSMVISEIDPDEEEDK